MADLVLRDYNGRETLIYNGIKKVGIPDTNDNIVVFDDTSDATATENDLAEGKTAYARGELIVGNGRVVEQGSAFVSFIGTDLTITPTEYLELDGIL